MEFRYVPLCTPLPEGGCDSHGEHCPTPGKRPLEPDWASAWVHDREDGRNYGVLTGPDTGLLVVDVDSLAALQTYESWGLPDTFYVQSGRADNVGRHYYFRWPAGLLRVPNRLDEVEIKGPGRQVVAWDSLHMSGNRYVKHAAPLAELPAAFVERLRQSTAQIERGPVLDALPGAVEALDRILAELPEGRELHDGNVETICPAHSDHDPSLVLGLSGERVLLHCRAGCTAGEVMDALGLPLSALWAPPELGYFDPTDELRWTAIRVRDHGALGDRFRLKELMAVDLPPISWAVPGVVPEGLTLLAGPPKLGKSWLVLDLAISVAAGREFLGAELRQGEALYLALEDNPRRLQGRARMLLGREDPPEGLELWTRAGKLHTGLVPELEAWLDEQPCPRLVIIDTLGRVQEQSPWADAKDGGYGDAVDALAELQAVAASRGVAVVVVTHTKKGGWSAGADPLEAVLGSQGYAGTADSILVLKRDRGEEVGELFVTGREIEEELTMKVTFDVDRCRWVLGDAELSLEDAILNLLDDEPYKLSGNDVARKVGHRKVDVLDVLAALQLSGQAMTVQAKRRGGGQLWGPPIPVKSDS